MEGVNLFFGHALVIFHGSLQVPVLSLELGVALVKGFELLYQVGVFTHCVLNYIQIVRILRFQLLLGVHLLEAQFILQDGNFFLHLGLPQLQLFELLSEDHTIPYSLLEVGLVRQFFARV